MLLHLTKFCCIFSVGAKFCQAYGDLASEEAQADETQQTSFAIMGMCYSINFITLILHKHVLKYNINV